MRDQKTAQMLRTLTALGARVESATSSVSTMQLGDRTYPRQEVATQENRCLSWVKFDCSEHGYSTFNRCCPSAELRENYRENASQRCLLPNGHTGACRTSVPSQMAEDNLADIGVLMQPEYLTHRDVYNVNGKLIPVHNPLLDQSVGPWTVTKHDAGGLSIHKLDAAPKLAEVPAFYYCQIHGFGAVQCCTDSMTAVELAAMFGADQRKYMIRASLDKSRDHRSILNSKVTTRNKLTVEVNWVDGEPIFTFNAANKRKVPTKRNKSGTGGHTYLKHKTQTIFHDYDRGNVVCQHNVEPDKTLELVSRKLQDELSLGLLWESRWESGQFVERKMGENAQRIEQYVPNMLPSPDRVFTYSRGWLLSDRIESEGKSFRPDGTVCRVIKMGGSEDIHSVIPHYVRPSADAMPSADWFIPDVPMPEDGEAFPAYGTSYDDDGNVRIYVPPMSLDVGYINMDRGIPNRVSKWSNEGWEWAVNHSHFLARMRFTSLRMNDTSLIVPVDLRKHHADRVTFSPNWRGRAYHHRFIMDTISRGKLRYSAPAAAVVMAEILAKTNLPKAARKEGEPWFKMVPRIRPMVPCHRVKTLRRHASLAANGADFRDKTIQARNLIKSRPIVLDDGVILTGPSVVMLLDRRSLKPIPKGRPKGAGKGKGKVKADGTVLTPAEKQARYRANKAALKVAMAGK